MKVIARVPSDKPIYVDDVADPQFFLVGHACFRYPDKKEISYMDKNMKLNHIALYELFEKVVINMDFKVDDYSSYNDTFMLRPIGISKYFNNTKDSLIFPAVTPRTMMKIIDDMQTGRLTFENGVANANFTIVKKGPKYFFEYLGKE